MATIQGVYVALFGRPADPAGLAYFNGITNNGADLAKIGVLSGQAEYTARFAGQSNTQIITTIYQSLFGRAPEAAGLTFFVDALNKGTLSINNIAIAIVDGAQGADKTLVEKKIAAANLFTAELDTPVEVGNYTGSVAASKGVAFLSAVTATSPAVTKDAAAAAVTTLAVDSGVTGVTITLTNAAEAVSTTAANTALKSTAGDDTINGTAVTLTAATKIDAGAGSDTINFTGAAGNAGAAGAGGVAGAAGGAVNSASFQPDTTNVEKFFVTGAGGAGAAGTAGAGNVGGAGGAVTTSIDVTKMVGVTQLWNSTTVGTTGATVAGIAGGAGGAHNVVYTEVLKTQTLGLKGTVGGTTDFTFKASEVAGTSDVATLALDKSVAPGLTTIAGIETLNISNTGASSVNLSIVASTSVVAKGTGDLDLTVANTAVSLATVDASALNGGLKFDASALNAVSSVKGGLLGDTITLDVAGNTVALVVDGGAGADTLIVGNGMGNDFAVSLTGGAGPDTFRFSDLGNVKTATSADFQKSIVTITDFDKANDTIDVKAMGASLVVTDRVTFTPTELTNISAKGSLFEAVQTAVSVINDNGKFGVFVWSGDSYIVNDNGVAGTFDAGDGLIKITGISSVADLTATNFLVL